MPANPNAKKWAIVDSKLKVKEARKKGIRSYLLSENARPVTFNSFSASEQYRKGKKIKNAKSIPIAPESLKVFKPEKQTVAKIERMRKTSKKMNPKTHDDSDFDELIEIYGKKKKKGK